MLYIDFKISGVDVLCDREKIPEGNDIGIRTTFSEDWASLDKYVTYRKHTMGGFSTGELMISSGTTDTTDVFYGADFVEIGFIGRNSERVLMSSHVIGVKLEKGAYIFDAGVKADDLSLSKTVSDLRIDVDGLGVDVDGLKQRIETAENDINKANLDITQANEDIQAVGEKVTVLEEKNENIEASISSLEVPAHPVSGVTIQELYDNGKVELAEATYDGTAFNMPYLSSRVKININGYTEFVLRTTTDDILVVVDGTIIPKDTDGRFVYAGVVNDEIAISGHSVVDVEFFSSSGKYTGGILSPELAEKLYKTSIFTQEEKSKVGKIDNLETEIAQLKKDYALVGATFDEVHEYAEDIIGGDSE